MTDFITTFPNYPDGYTTRASHYAYRRRDLAASPTEEGQYLEKALSDYDAAIRFSPNKGDTYYNKAKLIYEIALGEEEAVHPQWTMETAIDVLQQAIRENDLPLYRQLEGIVIFPREIMNGLWRHISRLIKVDMASPASFYWASKAMENIPGSNIGEILAC